MNSPRVRKVVGDADHPLGKNTNRVAAFFDEMRSTLERGDAVKLAGFGVFQLRDKAPRPGRNPKSCEEALIKARRVVIVHANARLKAAVEYVSSLI
jgi:integration host factor subunit alpha